jgi:hypothetical protein
MKVGIGASRQEMYGMASEEPLGDELELKDTLGDTADAGAATFYL